MNIYIDTSAISKLGHNFSQTQYIKIALLCMKHGFTLSVHELVKMEAESQITLKLLSDIMSVTQALQRVERKASNSDLKCELAKVVNFIAEHKEDLISDKLTSFRAWLKKV